MGVSPELLERIRGEFLEMPDLKITTAQACRLWNLIDSQCLADHRIAVADVLDAWLAPDHRYFKLKGEDGDTYIVRHDEQRGIWELTMFRADRKA